MKHFHSVGTVGAWCLGLRSTVMVLAAGVVILMGSMVGASELVTRDISQLGLGGSPELGGLTVNSMRELHWWHVGGGFGSGGEGGGVEGTLGWMLNYLPKPYQPQYNGRGLELGGAAFTDEAVYHITSRGVAHRSYYMTELSPSRYVGRDFGLMPGKYSPGAAAVWRGELYFAMGSDDPILDLVPRGRFLVHAMEVAKYPKPAATTSRLVADGSGDMATLYGRMVKMGFVVQPVVGGGEAAFGIMLAANGDLLRFLPQPIPGLDIAATRVATGVTDFAIRRERVRSNGSLFGVERDVLYVAYREKQGEVSKLVTRDLVTDVERLIYAAGSGVRLTSVGYDTTHLFVAERDVECSLFFGVLLCDLKEGRVRSKTRGDGFRFLTGEEADANWAVVEDGIATHLCSDNQKVFFTRGAEVRRFPSDAPPVRVNLKPMAMEVVQTIQDLNNSVQLVEGKATFVRGYAWVSENTTDRAGWYPSSQLEVRRGGGLVGVLKPLRGGYVDGVTNLFEMRERTTRDFLFEVPRDWVQAGELTLTFVVNPGGGAPEQGVGVAFDNHRTATMQVVRSSPIEVQMRAVEAVLTQNYNPMEDPVFPMILARATSMMPVPEIRWSIHPQVLSGPYNPADDDEWSDALSDLNSGAFFENLLRSGIPGYRAGTFGYRSPRAEGAFTAGLGYRPGWSLLFRVDDDFGAVDPFNYPRSGVVLAHELGHNLGVKHVNNAFTTVPLVPSQCANFSPNGPFEPYPYDGCWFGIPSFVAVSNLIQRFDLAYGFDALNQKPVSPWAGGDVMSYRNTSWTSVYTWRRMLQGIPGADPVTPFARAIQLGMKVKPAADEDLNGPVMLFRGRRNSVTGEWVVREVLRLPAGWVEPEQIQASLDRIQASGSELRLRLVDFTGAEVVSYRMVLEPSDEGTSVWETAWMVVPDREGVNGVEVVGADGGVVVSRVGSVNAPSVVWGGVPVVDEAAGRLGVTLGMSDVDGDEVRATVQYSSDDGATWVLLAQGVASGEHRWETRYLAGGEACRLRVVASDGFRSTVGVSEAFRVATHAPEMIATGVVEGAVYDYGKELVLEMSGFDAEDGGRPDASMSWEVVGPTIRVVNSGHMLVRDLAPGAYTARATIYDSEGNFKVQSFGFSVKPAVIPEGEAAAVMDGEVSEPDYGAGVEFSLPPERSARVRMYHVPPYVYVGVTGLKYKGDGNGPATFSVSMNVRGLGADVYGPNDVKWTLNELGRKTVEVGAGNGVWEMDETRDGALVGAVTRGDQEWTAEMRIHESALEGWGHLIAMKLDHDYRLPAAPSETCWPPDIGAPEIPFLWAPVALGVGGLPEEVRIQVDREADGGVLLRWPAAGAGWVLESAESIPDGVWTAVDPAPGAGVLEYRASAKTPAKFYRLRKP